MHSPAATRLGPIDRQVGVGCNLRVGLCDTMS